MRFHFLFLQLYMSIEIRKVNAAFFKSPELQEIFVIQESASDVLNIFMGFCRGNSRISTLCMKSAFNFNIFTSAIVEKNLMR